MASITIRNLDEQTKARGALRGPPNWIAIFFRLVA
jgi:hypothetical protein